MDTRDERIAAIMAALQRGEIPAGVIACRPFREPPGNDVTRAMRLAGEESQVDTAEEEW